MRTLTPPGSTAASTWARRRVRTSSHRSEARSRSRGSFRLEARRSRFKRRSATRRRSSISVRSACHAARTSARGRSSEPSDRAARSTCRSPTSISESASPPTSRATSIRSRSCPDVPRLHRRGWRTHRSRSRRRPPSPSRLPQRLAARASRSRPNPPRPPGCRRRLRPPLRWPRRRRTRSPVLPRRPEPRLRRPQQSLGAGSRARALPGPLRIRWRGPERWAPHRMRCATRACCERRGVDSTMPPPSRPTGLRPTRTRGGAPQTSPGALRAFRSWAVPAGSSSASESCRW